jgi:hypothetical protein
MNWKPQHDQLLLFMRHIGISTNSCADILSREFGPLGFTRNGCIGRSYRLKERGIEYIYNEKDFEVEDE